MQKEAPFFMNQTLHQDAMKIVDAAISAVLPDAAVQKALAGRSFPGRVYLVAVGKAAWQMAKAALDSLDTPIEAGIVLTGTEIKSVRQGKVSIKESYARIKDGEMMLYGMNISPYEQGNRFNTDPLRDRKLLLHKQEIRKLIGQTTLKGLTIVPLKMYINEDGLAKVEIGLARGKKNYDKREDIAKRDAKRDIDRRMKNR